MLIRLAVDADRDGVWAALEEGIRDGQACAIPVDYTREPTLDFWMAPGRIVYVAEVDGRIVGTYYLRTNQLGPGDHVCNAGYSVSTAGRGRGVASAMCRHSLDEARRMGYLAMQFNFVVATNEVAVRLWQKMGFQIIGVMPKAYRHPTQGLVDALVMWQWLGGSNALMPRGADSQKDAVRADAGRKRPG